MNVHINTEAEFDACVKSIGGIKVSELFQGSPTFDNADYWFEKYNVVAELKCLSEDKSTDKYIQEKTELIIRKYLPESKIVVFGTCRVTTDKLSPACTKEIAELYRKPIRGAMKKANRQIRETKKELKVESAQGLLILVNDENTAVDPSRINWILAETFRRDSFRSINSVLFVTLNLVGTHPATKNDLLVWIEFYRDLGFLCPQGLYENLRTALHIRWEDILGQEIKPFEVKNHDLIHELEYKTTGNGKILIDLDK
jgi:hypothetical protein